MQEDILRDIRKRCRLAMNGIASTSMRERGLNYKLNFGLVSSQIKDIAGHYSPNTELADTLWSEDVRELKILATLLYPIAEFTESAADRWVAQIPNQEIREQVCFNLFQELPFAINKGLQWSQSGNPDIRTTAYWLLARLFLSKKANRLLPVSSFGFLWEDIIREDNLLRNAAVLLLKQLGKQSKSCADEILDRLSVYKDDNDLSRQELYNGLAFEFEYFYED